MNWWHELRAAAADAYDAVSMVFWDVLPLAVAAGLSLWVTC